MAAAAPANGSAQDAAAAEPPLKLIAASKSIVLDRYEDGVSVELGTHLVAGAKPFELRVKRKSFKDPIVVEQIVDGKAKALPAGLTTNYLGLPNFTRLTIFDATGKKLVDRGQTFCPNSYDSARTRPDAPDKTPYPEQCSPNGFTVSNVWGIQSGWTARPAEPQQIKLWMGKYTAKVEVAPKYRTMFGIPANQASTTINITVRKAPPGGHGKLADKLAAERRQQARIEAAKPQPKPNAKAPVGKDNVPAGPKPDLVALPAWGARISKGEEGTPTAKNDFMQFAATVYNAGPSTLVLDGYRRQGQDLMDAYQYFYNEKGQQVGHAKTGTMEWDPRDGHFHWHFTDFASYRLLKANQTEIVRSQKEAFCLAATDQIDQLAKNANWHPMNTDLHTACGDYSSVAVREVLDVGAGDTYDQTRPGQSFDITNLPNGTYYIQVLANPEKRLFESNTTNNNALRKVILGGKKGARTVQVPAHDLVNWNG
ncbi:lysyl oxidase family protein [Kribbella deserti]|uniref:Lysyl oxidase family protein n=1 Tax=Kribbella deserti TaxID=1926257 RepID=A0ABV6QE18_9ACTN